MFRSRYYSLLKRGAISVKQKQRPRLHLERLEDRCVPSVTVTSVIGPSTVSASVPVAVEGVAAIPALNAAFTDTTSLSASQYNVTVDYGDGVPPSTTVNPAPNGTVFDSNLIVSGSGGSYTITDNHQFPEESGAVAPGPSGTTFTITVTVTENVAPNASGTGTGTAQVLDAPLSAGNPLGNVPFTTVTGGVGNALTASQAVTTFESDIGGVHNTAPAPQTGGFRVINWDAVKVDGSDAVAGPNSTVVITQGHTVGIPLNRFEGQGVFFKNIYAVSNDGFVDVNPNVGPTANNPTNPALFPAFSNPNTFAPFNGNTIDLKFVAPNPTSSAPVPATSPGFGAIFLNVLQSGSTITYYHGSTVLATLGVPTTFGNLGAPEFVGALFDSPVVTEVLLTLGNGVIFKFDGTAVTSGGVNNATTNLVATDDFVYAEPVPVPNGVPVVSAAAVTTAMNVAFTGVVATFSDADPNGNAKDYTATINWGDGHFSNGTIAANANGGFDVSGTDTYAFPGNYPISVMVQDFGGGPGTGSSQPALTLSNTALVSAGDQNFRFVAEVYLDLLGRKVDPSGLAFWGGLLDAGLSNRGQVVVGIETSLEYRIVEVTHAYQQFLNRPPDPGGLNTFVQFLMGGGTVEQMKAIIAGSPEFFNLSQTQSHPAGVTTPNQQFVDSLFRSVLGRPADPSGLSVFTQELNANVAASVVALQVLTSPEAEMDLVKSSYVAFLRRPADPAGLTGFTDQLLAGATDEQIIASLVASGEYFGNV
jgi:hypothetical protein